MEADSSQELKLKLAQEIRSDSRKLTEIREISNPNSFRFGKLCRNYFNQEAQFDKKYFFRSWKDKNHMFFVIQSTDAEPYF